MKQEDRKMSRRGKWLLGVLFAVCMIAVMMPVVAFADDDADRASGSLYILGTKITETGEIYQEVPHTGYMYYDAENKELILQGVTMDVSNYREEAGTENNYVAAISAWSDLTITLKGKNYIRSEMAGQYGEGKEFVFGIKNSGGTTTIKRADDADDKKEHSLSIDIYTNNYNQFCTGISCSRDLTVSNCDLNVDLDGFLKCIGMDLRCCNFMIENGAFVKVKACGDGSIGVNGSGIFDKSYVSKGSGICMAGDGAAFKCWVASDALKDTRALVSENIGGEGVTDWDKETALAEYKFILFEAPDDPPRGSGGVYILSDKVEKGDVPKTIPHEGTIHYDPDSNTLTLTNVTLDLLHHSRVVEGNVVAGIYATSDLNVVLVGNNKIICSHEYTAYMPDQYVYGIWGGGKVNITCKRSSALDSLSVTLAMADSDVNKNISISALESDGEITFDNASVNFDLGQYGKCTGIYSWSPINVKNGSVVEVIAEGSNGKAVSGINPIGNSRIEEGSCLEMISDGTAFDCWTPPTELKETPAWVNEKATAEGATEWNKSTALYAYKYVRFGEWAVTVLAPLDISQADVSVTSQVTYTGKALTPEVTVKAGGFTLIRNVDYNLKYANNKNAGTATVTVKGISSITGEKTLRFRILKANNKLKVRGKTATVKYKVLKKKNRKLDVSKVIKFVSNGKGKMVYAKISGNKKIKINKKTGKVTLKKGLKKGKYKMKVKVRAKGNDNYKASAWKKVTIKIKVVD